MSLSLSPFPNYLHPPYGAVSSLPVTRDGLSQVPEGELTTAMGELFAELIMRRKLDDKVSRGICGLVPAAAFIDGRIKPHENTLTGRLQRQRELIISDGGALGKPVLLTASDVGAVWSDIADKYEPATDCVSFNGFAADYQLRPLRSSASLLLSDIDLTNLGTLVIADGHHRAETHAALSAAGYANCDYIPVCIVDARELTIGIFLRAFPLYDGSVDELRSALAPHFSVRSVKYPTAPTPEGVWLMTYRGNHYELARRSSNATHSTQLGWLTREVFPDVFGITNPQSDNRLINLEVNVLPNGLLDLVDTSQLSLAGTPVSRETFFSEVAAGRVFPPKSTRFLPRVPSGLLVWPGWKG